MTISKMYGTAVKNFPSHSVFYRSSDGQEAKIQACESE